MAHLRAYKGECYTKSQDSSRCNIRKWVIIRCWSCTAVGLSARLSRIRAKVTPRNGVYLFTTQRYELRKSRIGNILSEDRNHGEATSKRERERERKRTTRERKKKEKGGSAAVPRLGSCSVPGDVNLRLRAAPTALHCQAHKFPSSTKSQATWTASNLGMGDVAIHYRRHRFQM